MTEVIAYIGLGSNLADPLTQVQMAYQRLSSLENTEVLRRSHWYCSQPFGIISQPNFINGVAEIKTTLSPNELLQALQNLEKEQGRDYSAMRWGPRIIDLDILLYGNVTMHTDILTIPHPGLREREFVLYPLAEMLETFESLKYSIPSRGIVQMEEKIL